MKTNTCMTTNRRAPLRKDVWAIAVCLLCLGSAAFYSGCAVKPEKRYTMDGQEMQWADMSRDQRKRHMQQEVIPLAGKVFASWRPERYGEITCALCHGTGVQSDDFHMPTDHLPRLSGELFLGTEFRNHAETTRIKLDRLVPGMAEILGQPAFSLLTQQGFGCYSCHLGPNGPLFGN